MADSRNPASPLSGTSVAQALLVTGLDVPPVTFLAVADSTNDEALALASNGAPEWSTVVADQQRAGRGRLGRSWETPPGQALLFSTILRPPPDWAAAAWGWIPLIAGMGICQAIRGHSSGGQLATVGLKWPNDVVIDGNAHDGSPGPRKLAGILAERRGDGVVVGVGINVGHNQAMLPIPAATSVAIEGAHVSRAVLLADCLTAWHALWEQFVQARGDAGQSGIRDKYRAMCLTLGRRVRVDVAGVDLVGEATDIDDDGHVIVDGSFGRRNVSAGDVIHLRH